MNIDMIYKEGDKIVLRSDLVEVGIRKYLL